MTWGVDARPKTARSGSPTASDPLRLSGGLKVWWRQERAWGIPGRVRDHDEPGCACAVDRGQVGAQPLVLRAALLVGHVRADHHPVHACPTASVQSEPARQRIARRLSTHVPTMHTLTNHCRLGTAVQCVPQHDRSLCRTVRLLQRGCDHVLNTNKTKCNRNTSAASSTRSPPCWKQEHFISLDMEAPHRPRQKVWEVRRLTVVGSLIRDYAIRQ